MNILVEQIICYKKSGMFFPQDAQTVCTWEMFRLIRKANGKSCYGIKIATPLIRLFVILGVPVVEELWGNLYYTAELSETEGIRYQKYPLTEAIQDIVKSEI